MIRRSLLCGLIGLSLACGAGPAAARTAVQTAPDPAVVPVRIALQTGMGRIVIETDPRAPITASNFVRYADERRFDGVTFYRGMTVAPGTGLVQGGPIGVSNRVRPPIAHEPTSQTGLSHVNGAVSMAAASPGTATGDFFIVIGDLPSLNAGVTTPEDQGFAVFGRVVEGMDVVEAIVAAPKSPTEGEGVMRGQMLDPRVPILSARRVDIPGS
ncbi:MAG: peptidylprolyl isomerase [Brevundimonas sp.]|nr:MAG: peptidylprolyl isomerase [Brevundimonas sp.]